MDPNESNQKSKWLALIVWTPADSSEKNSKELSVIEHF